MSRRFYIKKSYAYTLKEHMDICIKYNNTIVYNTDKTIDVSDGLRNLKGQVLELLSTTCMEDFNSGQDALSKCRPEFLVIQNIISFFGGIPLTVYNEVNGSCFSLIEDYNYESIYKSKDIQLVIDGVDYTSQLIKVLDHLNNNKELIISLLDRWRKANYLQSESCDANLYHDEAILSYFHIIELFAESSSDEFKKRLGKSMEILLETYYKENLFYTDKQIINKVTSLKEITNEVLVKKELSLAQKIKYFLKKYDLLDENVSNFIDSAIKIRNSIAHGRITYKEKVIYPLPPFFYLANKSYDILEFLNFLTARMIAAYMGIDCWKEEWEEAKEYLLPPTDILSEFLKHVDDFKNINVESLIEGNEYNITWNTIYRHYIGNSKKFNINRIADSLQKYFIDTVVTEENCLDLLNISVVLSDCKNDSVKKKSINNVKEIVDRKLATRAELKDLNNYLDYYDLSSQWFKKYLFGK